MLWDLKLLSGSQCSVEHYFSTETFYFICKFFYIGSLSVCLVNGKSINQIILSWLSSIKGIELSFCHLERKRVLITSRLPGAERCSIHGAIASGELLTWGPERESTVAANSSISPQDSTQSSGSWLFTTSENSDNKEWAQLKSVFVFLVFDHPFYFLSVPSVFTKNLHPIPDIFLSPLPERDVPLQIL